MTYPPICEKTLTRALLFTITQWDVERDMLPIADAIDPLWFPGFLTRWRLHRTFRSRQEDGLTEKIIALLNHDHLEKLRNATTAKAVDALTDALKPLVSKEPRSFASKIAFFIKPELFVPRDSLSIIAMNHLGIPTAADCNYETYFEHYDMLYTHYSKQVETACHHASVSHFIERLGLEKDLNKSTAFKRKLFDSYLVIKGRKLSS